MLIVRQHCNMGTKLTHPEEDDATLTHLEEYKEVRAEIRLYQQEMHNTWLWAIIPAGATYTWLSLHVKELGRVPAPIWFVPAVLTFLCVMRYRVFSSRIERLAQYQCLLEEHAFGGEGLCGVARWNHKGLRCRYARGPASKRCRRLARFILKALACRRRKRLRRLWHFVYWVQRPHLKVLTGGASLVWLGLLIASFGLSWTLWQRDVANSKSASRDAAGGQVASPVLIYPAFPVSPSVSPVLTGSNSAKSQPTKKP